VLTSSASSGNVWSDNETSQSITVSSEGTYTVSTTQNGCSSSASAPVTVTIAPAPQPQITASQQAICAGSSVTLDATTTAATAYLWSNTSTQPSITISSAGSYKVTVTVNGCTGVDSITINAMPQLGGLSLQDTFAVCDGDSVVLDASTANATSYLWSAGGATTALLTARNEGAYYVTVSNNCGLIIDSTHLSFKDCNCKIVMPNAFTPNADSKNETFGPNFKCTNPKYLLMRIFNRWGEKIFETNDLYGRWDGSYKNTQQPPGVYVYYVEFVGAENTTEKTTQLMGSVTLIR
jgi:gliding motility-associated-like protein